MKKKNFITTLSLSVLACSLLLTGCLDDEPYYEDGYNGSEYSDDYYQYGENYNDYEYSDYGDYENYEGDEYEGNEYDYYDAQYEDYESNNNWFSSNDYYEFDSDYSQYGLSPSDVTISGNYPLGTAGEMEGTTVVVSIFANDNVSSWDKNADSKLMYNSLNSLKIATEFLTENAAAYGCNANFVYDWSADNDLYSEMTLSIDTPNELDNADYMVWPFINTSIDSNTLMSRYNANNIIYLIILNTVKSNTVTSCTRNWYDGMVYPYEFIYIFDWTENLEETPSAYAHEILHTFGAPDLYRADTDGYNYGITKEYVQSLESSKSNDIMFTTYNAKTYESEYGFISNEFTEIDAYYVGLTNSSSVVNEWGFKQSEH